MTGTEKKLLFGFGLLGLLILVMSMAVAGAVLVAGTSLNVTLPNETALGVRAPASVSQVIESAEQQVAEAADRVAGESAAAPRVALPLPGGEADLAQLYEQVEPGVVSIEVRQTVRSPFGNGSLVQQSSGSGFVFDDSHVVTNNHVVSGADMVELVFFDGQRRAGQVLATDLFTDLAVVQVADMPANARALPVVKQFDELQVGQPVIALGNPFGNANTMTYGIISALGRVIPSGLTDFSIPQAIQTDAAINPGNSGGPLLDLRGQVIGVNAQINTTNLQASGPPGNSGVGFAVPASVVARVVPALIKDGKVEWSYLGVTGLGDMSLAVAEANNLTGTQGAYITSVVAGGPSDGQLTGAANVAAPVQAQGLQGQGGQGGSQIVPLAPSQQETPLGGDLVVAVDGRPVKSFDDLLTYIALETAPGQTVTLKVLRAGRELTVPIQLSARPTGGQVRSQPE